MQGSARRRWRSFTPDTVDEQFAGDRRAGRFQQQREDELLSGPSHVIDPTAGDARQRPQREYGRRSRRPPADHLLEAIGGHGGPLRRNDGECLSCREVRCNTGPPGPLQSLCHAAGRPGRAIRPRGFLDASKRDPRVPQATRDTMKARPRGYAVATEGGKRCCPTTGEPERFQKSAWRLPPPPTASGAGCGIRPSIEPTRPWKRSSTSSEIAGGTATGTGPGTTATPFPTDATRRSSGFAVACLPRPPTVPARSHGTGRAPGLSGLQVDHYWPFGPVERSSLSIA